MPLSFATMHDVLRDVPADLATAVVLAQPGFQNTVSDALDATGRWHQRHCTLQAPLVVAGVILMSFHRPLSIVNVFKRVLDVMRGESDVSLKSVTAEAFYHARARLGREPLRLVAQGLVPLPAPSFLGLIPVAIDGVKFDVPDTPANDEEFDRPCGSRGRAAYPQMGGLGLIYVVTRQVIDCVWGRYNLSELGNVGALLTHLDSRHVVFLDRRYTCIDLWFTLLDRRVHVVHRLSASYKPKPVKQLGVGDWLIDVGRWVEIPEQEREGRQKRRWESRRLRIIEYEVGQRERVRLLTDLLDPIQFPAIELARGYHLRWDIELTNDENKTHLSTVCHGTQPTIFRSKTPEGIYQEAWALVAAYNIVRGLMTEAGATHNVPPLAISFVETVEVVRMTWPKLYAAQTPAQRDRIRARMLRDIADCRLDRPRRKRHAPRVVKRKMSNFKLKRAHHHSVEEDLAAQLRLVDSG